MNLSPMVFDPTVVEGLVGAERKRFLRLATTALVDSSARPSLRVFFLRLLLLSVEERTTGSLCLTKAVISERTGFAASTYSLLTSQLDALGVIEVVRRKRPDGSDLPSRIELKGFA